MSDTPEVTYPDITVQLTGQDGNVFNLIGIVQAAVRRVHGDDAAKEVYRKATSCSSYNEVLIYLMKTVNVE